MTDPTDLIAQADAALDGVTDGPWVVSHNDGVSVITQGNIGICEEFGDVDNPEEWPAIEADSRFVAASRQLVPALRDALSAALTRAEAAECHAEAMEAERDALRMALDDTISRAEAHTECCQSCAGIGHELRAALSGEPQP